MFLGLFKRKVKLVKVKSKPKAKKAAGPKIKKRKASKPKPKARVAKLKSRKRPVVKKAAKKPARSVKVMPQAIGKVTHYFPHVKAGVILVTKGTVTIGDTLRIKGHTTDFKQKITSMQIDNAPIEEAKAGQEIGILVKSRVRHNDIVYKL